MLVQSVEDPAEPIFKSVCLCDKVCLAGELHHGDLILRLTQSNQTLGCQTISSLFSVGETFLAKELFSFFYVSC